jgi:hypothetical protein
MKIYSFLFIIIIFLSFNAGCINKGSKNVKSKAENLIGKSTEADTGFTGIQKSFSGGRLANEITFKNGIRHGLMKTFYPGGQLRQTFWYENGLRSDTARWYFEDGKLFRKTPYLKDSVNGTQIQYYKDGKVRAKLSFVNGLRTPYLEEFSNTGQKITSYPDLVIKTKDDYNQNGTFKIYLELTERNTKVTYYRGEYIDGLFIPKKYTKIDVKNEQGYLILKKTGVSKTDYVGVIAEILTPLGNRYLVYKKIDLPYKDLN